MALVRLYCFRLLIKASYFCAKSSNVELSIIVSMYLTYAGNLEKNSRRIVCSSSGLARRCRPKIRLS